jgi:hypothetical protein
VTLPGLAKSGLTLIECWAKLPGPTRPGVPIAGRVPRPITFPGVCDMRTGVIAVGRETLGAKPLALRDIGSVRTGIMVAGRETLGTKLREGVGCKTERGLLPEGARLIAGAP